MGSDDDCLVAVLTATPAARVLDDLRRALVPDGIFTFDARNPSARKWEDWNPVDSRRRATLRDGSGFTASTEVTEVRDVRVSFNHTDQFVNGDELHSTATLRFRTEEDIRASLALAGFAVESSFGGWARERVGENDGEFPVVARTQQTV